LIYLSDAITLFLEIKVHEIFLKFRAKGKQTYQYRHGWRWFYVAAMFLHSKNSRSKIDKEVNF